MALITAVGFPSCGKSTRLLQLSRFLTDKINADDYSGPLSKVVIISDHSLSIPTSVYDESALEKPARGILFAAILRSMSPDTILIIDSLNYIKGFRYQIYCASREMKLRNCTIFVVASADDCRRWNANRDPSLQYRDMTLDNLFSRFEEPSSMARWDSPLFTILSSDKELPFSSVWDAITLGTVKPPNSGTLAVSRAPTNALHVLEQTTTTVVSLIIGQASGDGGKVVLPLTDKLRIEVALPQRLVTLSELQRAKRQFITIHKKAITLGSTERGAVDWGEENVARKFVDYLEENIN